MDAGADGEQGMHTMGAAVRGADGQMHGGINLYHFTGKAALRRGHTFPPVVPHPWPRG